MTDVLNFPSPPARPDLFSDGFPPAIGKLYRTTLRRPKRWWQFWVWPFEERTIRVLGWEGNSIHYELADE